MSRKRPAEVASKLDPDAKPIKSEDDNLLDLCSIPKAPAATAACISSAAIVPKPEPGCDESDRKPHALPSRSFRRHRPRRRIQHGKFMAVHPDGNDWVRAHFNKRMMTVEYTVLRSHDAVWVSSHVEKQIFGRLHNAKFFVEPLEDYGFIDRIIRSTFVFQGSELTGGNRMNLDRALPLSLVGNSDNSITIHCAQHVRKMAWQRVAAICNKGCFHLHLPALAPKREGVDFKAEQEIKTEEGINMMVRRH